MMASPVKMTHAGNDSLVMIFRLEPMVGMSQLTLSQRVKQKDC